MDARVVQIGTSIGVIVPKPIVKEMELRVGHKLDLLINNRAEIVLKKKKDAREGWSKAFASKNSECNRIEYVEVEGTNELSGQKV